LGTQQPYYSTIQSKIVFFDKKSIILERIVIKNLIKACALIAGLFAVSGASAQQVYNSIATAYVTTTISQFVVFDSTMQQGGTFDFSVLAHNGGGRAGQSDTANVKIEFFTSGNALVTSANTSFSNNLPNPTALGGNPQIDPAVPWTTLAISKTLTQAQAATVAYAKVSMYGIDGSYWAGDYGPWYRAPTLTVNGAGNNMLYNPEFGPYNNITAQGWTASPGFGACQGAWGGSNACIVNSSGQPGQSTVGLVANQNGGGPSATGGTISGTAGGYNSTMSTNNPGGGTPAPSGPTVVSTAAGTPVVTTSQPVAGSPVVTTTTVQRTVNGTDANGNPTVTTYNDTVTTTTTPYTTTTTTTPTTVTTYSDGSTTTTNGSPTTSTSSSSTTTTSTSAGGVASVATTAPVAAAPVVVRGTPVVSAVNTPGQTTTTAVNTRGITMENKSSFYQVAQGARTTDVAKTVVTTDVTPITTTTTAVTPITTVTTTVTPITTTVTTTPTTTTVDGSGNVISTTYGTPTDSVTNSQETVNVTTVNNQVVTTSVVNNEVIQTPVTTRGSASNTGITDITKAARSNPFIVDALSTKDGAWVIPGFSRTTINGRMNANTLSGGWQTSADNNTGGFAFSATQTESAGYINTRTSGDSYTGTVYALTKQEYVWVKASAGVSKGVYSTSTNIPEVGLTGGSKAAQTLVYGDVTLYSAENYWGFRPLVGVTVVRSTITDAWNTNPMLTATPRTGATVQTLPYAGLRYEFNDNVSLEARTTQTRDFGNVKSIKATVKQEIFDDISVNASISYAKGNRYTNTTGMVGLDWKF